MGPQQPRSALPEADATRLALDIATARGRAVGRRDPLGEVEQAAVAEEAFSVLRHILRNKLATVRNAAFYLKRRTAGSEPWKGDPRVEEFFEVIDEEIASADALVKDGVVSKHLFERRVERTHVRACVEKAVELSHIDNPAIQVRIEPDDGLVDLDPRELTLAVRCLVENAAEAMPSGGTVTVRLLSEDARFVIEVLDDGPGIPEAERKAVLYAYCTTKPGHAGLGLSIASRVVLRAQGSILIGSGPSGGTSVTLVFPKPDLEHEPKPPPALDTSPPQRMRID
jgi:signal transduction histidine kinase